VVGVVGAVVHRSVESSVAAGGFVRDSEGEAMRRVFLALLGMALAVAACGTTTPRAAPPPTSGPPPSSASTTSTTLPVTTTTLPDTSVVPAHITVAYVNAVFAKLDAVLGNAVRAAERSRKISLTVQRDLASIYAQRLELTEEVGFAQVLAGGSRNIRRDPGNEVVRVEQLVTASPTCIFARVSVDYSSVIRTPSLVTDVWEGLERKPRSLLSLRKINPTPWIIFYLLRTPRNSHLSTKCTS